MAPEIDVETAPMDLNKWDITNVHQIHINQ